MPTIHLTDRPTAIMPAHTLEVLWEMEIFAHALYPHPNAGAERKSWVEKVQRQFASDYTKRVMPLPTAVEFHRYWFTLLDFARTNGGINNLKPNENRDLQHAARILIHCTQDKMSKAKATTCIAKESLCLGRGNSLSSAEAAVKRAWREYSAGCHFAAACLMLASRMDEADGRFASLEIISLAEHLRTQGECRISPRGAAPLLDAAKTWKVPDNYPLLRVAVVSLKSSMRSIRFEPARSRDDAALG